MNLFFFKVKTKLETQVDEYVVEKAKKSIFTAPRHAEVLAKYLDFCKFKTIEEISLDSIDSFYRKSKEEVSPFGMVKTMEAIRGFMRHTRKLHNIDPDRITNQGVVFPILTRVDESAKIPVMKRKKFGRPFKDVELIKKVKRLRDREQLSFRKIAGVVEKDVGQVHRMYRHDLTQI